MKVENIQTRGRQASEYVLSTISSAKGADEVELPVKVSCAAVLQQKAEKSGNQKGPRSEKRWF